VKREDSQEHVSGHEVQIGTLLSHQLRSPLSVIKWHTEMMLDGDAGQLTVEQREYLEHIHAGYQQTAAMIDSLLRNITDHEPAKVQV
jgi:signal transduction histidine kinase